MKLLVKHINEYKRKFFCLQISILLAVSINKALRLFLSTHLIDMFEQKNVRLGNQVNGGELRVSFQGWGSYLQQGVANV